MSVIYADQPSFVAIQNSHLPCFPGILYCTGHNIVFVSLHFMKETVVCNSRKASGN